MPAPPSTAVKAANARAISAAKSTATATRSTAPNAAAAAAANRISSGTLGKTTPSRVGNQVGGGGKTATTSITRNTVNPAAANANRMTAALKAGTTVSAPGKSNMFGADQTFGKGVNLSSGDLIKGGYRSYQQPPSARPAGFGPLSGIQMATARMNPSLSSIVAGDPQARFGGIPADAQNPSFATENYVKDSPAPRAPKDQSRVPSATSPTRLAAAGFRDYDPLSSVTRTTAPTPVAQNPARAFPSRPAAPTQTASYDPLSSVQRPAARPVSVADVPQLPGGASTVFKGVTPSMADFDMTALTREPTAYDPRGPQVATVQNPARAFPARPAAPAPTRTTFTQALLDKGFTGEGISTAGAEPTPASAPAPRISLRSPNPAAQRAWNIQRARDAAPPQQVVDGSLYGDTPSKPAYQRMADALTGTLDRKTAGGRNFGNRINAGLGGSPDGGVSSFNPNARDPLNNESVKVRQLVAAAQAGDKTAQDTLKTIAPWFIWNQWAPGSRPGLV